ncbi:hypothetical protein KR093_011782, partial [Drosophila rubida]
MIIRIKYILKVNKCNFIEYISSLEESDIEAFYAIYVQYAKFEPTPGQYSSSLGPLQIFLKDIYADFSPILDCEGRVTASDYVYVYTLLMHYTCVQNPSKYFHNICENLPEIVQQYIAAFFEQTVDGLQLTRDCLRQAILNIYSNTDEYSFLVPVIAKNSTPDRLNMHRSVSCSSSITTTSVSNDGINCSSPSLTDNNKNVSIIVSAAVENTKTVSQQRERISAISEIQICAPPTPKTELLELRTRELLGLRAQLETERYEKTVLEEQILENESLINALSKENIVKKKQLSVLKATLENECEDEHNFEPKEFEKMKRRLINELSNKEAMLSERNEQLQELRAEHSKLDEKFKMSEKHVLVCMDRINELEQRLNNLMELLSEKCKEIEYLKQDKVELQQCLQEVRSELQNGREVLNASSDLLNTSLLQSSMNTTPENLATSVIDKQLREKEMENDQLRSALEFNSQQKENIEKQLQQLLFKFQLANPENSSSQLKMLQIIGQGMEQLTVSKGVEQQRVNELQ